MLDCTFTVIVGYISGTKWGIFICISVPSRVPELWGILHAIESAMDQ